MPHDPNPIVTGVRRHDLPRTCTARTSPAGSGPGEAAFSARIERHLADCRRLQQQLAVLAIRVDQVNTIDGQPAPGLEESVVLEFGHRLRSRVRATDSVLWLGGCEHGVVLLDCRPDGARAVEQRLNSALGGVYRIGTTLVNTTPAIGVACHPAAGNTGSMLQAAAVDARHRAAVHGAASQR